MYKLTTPPDCRGFVRIGGHVSRPRPKSKLQDHRPSYLMLQLLQRPLEKTLTIQRRWLNPGDPRAA